MQDLRNQRTLVVIPPSNDPLQPSRPLEPLPEKSSNETKEKVKENIEKRALPLSPPPPGHKKQRALTIQIPTTTTTTQVNSIIDIQKAMTELELETRTQYVLESGSVHRETFFKSQHPGASIVYTATQGGVTETKRVEVDGKPSYILKKVSLSEAAIRLVSGVLGKAQRSTLKEKLKEVLIDKPMGDLIFRMPYICAAQREYFASIVGGNLGVPETVLLHDEEGIYSLHQFQENTGSRAMFGPLEENIYVQSLQNIVILDLIMENQDRNPGNILVVKGEDNKKILIPIDHALTFQTATLNASIMNWLSRPPCWANWSKIMEVALTEQTKQQVMQLSSEALLKKAKEKIVIEPDVEHQFTANIEKLKSLIKSADSLQALYDKWIGSFERPAST
jgi:hypothetical protein